MNQTMNHPQTSRLEQLPAELQAHISHHLLLQPEPLRIRTESKAEGPPNKDECAPHDDGDPSTVTTIPPAIPSIAQTSRSLRNQALPIYFSSNTFVLESETYLSDMPHRIPPSLTPWLELFDRHANDTARIGCSGWVPYLCCQATLFGSIQKTDGISYYWDSELETSDWGARRLEAMSRLSLATRSRFSRWVQMLFEACYVDWKDKLDWYREKYESGLDNGFVIVRNAEKCPPQ
ncbi:uncharacterized protein LTR77_007831 [Saxophila tyrrhenica]|uniref:Uncharacterized protein n=1 Tax=Saxophila tyrrhenica TaxID=1690608 RepID=A0AAV9P3N0_9PEZI|nr:hypothetical protein LTR77_007831 [Saxophila tyrrhenica]